MEPANQTYKTLRQYYQILIAEFEKMMENSQEDIEESKKRLMKLLEEFGKGYSEMDQLIEDYKHDEVELVEMDDGWLLLKDKAQDELHLTQFESFNSTF